MGIRGAISDLDERSGGCPRCRGCCTPTGTEPELSVERGKKEEAEKKK